MTDFDKSRIERLKRSLYSRNEDIVPKEKRTPVTGQESDVPTSWGDKPSFNMPYEQVGRKSNSFFNKFLLISLGFFVISLGVALFIFFGGINMISSNNVDIQVTAPSSVSSGEELPMGISVVNGNRTDLEEVVLLIDYPEGVETVDLGNKTLAHDRISLGTIAKGATKDHSIRSLLFGEKDAIKVFTLKLEYKVKGSNAVFSKEKTYDVLIGSSPRLLNVNYPQEITSGQPLALSIEITSNSSVVIKNSLVKVEYPYGFTFKDSNMKPLRDNAVWNIGDLKNGDKKTIIINGILIGQNLEDRSFRISAGTQSNSVTKDFDIDLAVSQVTVGIRKSFFDLGVSSTNSGATSVGQPVPVLIKYQNTLPEKIVNSHIEATISGEVFDRSSVSVSSGFYRSFDNTILWDKNNNDKLTSLLPGDSGQVSFSLSSISDLLQIRSTKDPHIDVHVVMTGDRSGGDGGEVSSSADITIKLSSTFSLTAKSYRAVGPFSNIGPIPPRADKESTYTLTLTMTNTTNDLKDVTLSGSLPIGVEWKGVISPSSERISYDPGTRTVSWNVGNVSAGTGFTYSPKGVSFQVSIIPSLNQIGSSPSLLSQIKVDSTDIYTTLPIKFTIDPVTTQYSDPGFKSSDSIVAK